MESGGEEKRERRNERGEEERIGGEEERGGGGERGGDDRGQRRRGERDHAPARTDGGPKVLSIGGLTAPSFPPVPMGARRCCPSAADRTERGMRPPVPMGARRCCRSPSSARTGGRPEVSPSLTADNELFTPVPESARRSAPA